MTRVTSLIRRCRSTKAELNLRSGHVVPRGGGNDAHDEGDCSRTFGIRACDDSGARRAQDKHAAPVVRGLRRRGDREARRNVHGCGRTSSPATRLPPSNIHRINWNWGSTKAMDAAGLKELPKTWADFNADCDKAIAAHLVCLAHFSQDWPDATTFEVVVYGQDIDLYRKAFVEGDTKAMRSDGMVEAFKQMRLMVSKYMDPGIAGRDYNTATSMIAKGQAAFMIMGDWQIGIFT